MSAITLKRTVSRFYLRTVQPDLFGSWSLVTEWGRNGCPGKAHTIRFRPRPRPKPRSSAAVGSAGQVPNRGSKVKTSLSVPVAIAGFQESDLAEHIRPEHNVPKLVTPQKTRCV